MTTLVTCVFVLTYLGMAAGRVPGLLIDRAGIAMIAAVALVAVGALPADQVAASVHFPTLLLLGSLMVLSGRVRAAGFYALVATWIAGQAHRPLRLLALTIIIGGGLSAVLVNDVVVFALTPLLCAGLASARLDPRPYLYGLAAASNVGSAATLIGNPQNILIGQVGRLDFWAYVGAAALPALFGMLATFACVALVWRSRLGTLGAADMAPSVPVAADQPLDRRGLMVSALGIAVLLALFATPLPREISALLIAACFILSRTIPSRQLLAEIDVPLLILFASLFIVNAAFAATGIPQLGVDWLAGAGLLPERVSLLAPFALLASNTIGNVPAVVMLLEVWRDLPPGTHTGLAILSTLAGNLLLVGSLANLIVAERAARAGVHLTFADHARAGIPITLLSMLFAGGWLWLAGYMAL